MGSLYPGGGYPAQYSQGGSAPPNFLTVPTAFVAVDARERFTPVEGLDRFVVVPAVPRLTPVGEA
jgi:hypothetical protein